MANEINEVLYEELTNSDEKIEKLKSKIKRKVKITTSLQIIASIFFAFIYFFNQFSHFPILLIFMYLLVIIMIGYFFSPIFENEVLAYAYDKIDREKIKKIKIFSLLESIKYDYTRIKFDNYTRKNGESIEDALKYLSLEASNIGATGIILHDGNTISNTNGTVSTSWGSVNGNISTTNSMIEKVEFIKDIKEKKSNEAIDNDINYWFDLKNKGAITEEEYLSQKNKILDKAQK